jgi:hypothetical protein
LFWRRWPALAGRIANAPAVVRMAGWFTRLQQTFDFSGANHSTFGSVPR